MDPSTLLPIRPASTSLPAHLAALDQTISHLSVLPSQTRWPAYVPLTSRARIPGQIVHPNEVKVNLGQGWWVDMTAAEAGEYLKRRKIALLEEQAKVLEGRSSSAVSSSEMGSGRVMLPPAVQLNGLFMGLESSKPAKEKASVPSLPAKAASGSHSTTLPQPPYITSHIPVPRATGMVTPRDTSSSASSITKPVKPTPKPPSPLASPPPVSLTPAPTSSAAIAPTPSSSSTIAQPSGEPETLEQVLERFLENEQSLAEASGGGRDTTTTEDGLPIHEIHETASGDIIGVKPEPTLSEAEAGRVGADGEDKKGKDEYHTEQAKARRRMLWEKVFGPDDDDDDKDDEGEEDDGEGKANVGEDEPVSPTTSSPRSASPELIAPLPSTRSSVSTTPAAPPPVPRSILKPPPQPVRKKSVSFDPTVPLPPDSPDPSSRKMGFQLPLVTTGDDGEFGPRPVPVIQAPVPKKGDGFGGMKRGFLDSGGKKVAEKEEAGKKKPSLFAQRMAQSVVKESIPSSSLPKLPPTTAPVATAAPAPQNTARVPGLPVMGKSDSSATNTLRSSVVEKPTPPPAAKASTSTPRNLVPADSGDGGGEVGYIDDDDDEDEDEEEVEDEYDLDDALLAREVALEYHRRRAYTSPYMSQDPDDPAYGYLPSETSSDGGVLLAMPQIDNTGSGGPTIINPTPDDFRRFVRVGKLENGNLVLAPGEEGWSDDEAGEDGEGVGELEVERQKKRDNRRKVMEGLLGKGDGGEEAGLRGKGTIGNPKATQVREEVGEKDLPPVVKAAPRETVAPAVGGVKERASGEVSAPTAEPPKRISKFKAARMGGV